MANLIPPNAKRAVTIEYWLRVVTVWCVLIGFGFIAVALLRLPTFVLVQSQLQAFSSAYDEAVDKTSTFEDAQETIVAANELSRLLVDEESQTAFSEMVEILDDIGGTDVRINEFRFSTDAEGENGIVISGVAATRVALADFSKDIEAHPLYAEAELPISNLAKDRDIAFSINISLEEE